MDKLNAGGMAVQQQVFDKCSDSNSSRRLSDDECDGNIVHYDENAVWSSFYRRIIKFFAAEDSEHQEQVKISN